MKRFLTALLASAILLSLLTLTGCDAPGVYKMNDVLPPLIDIKTQYPCLERITVVQVSTGKTLELTEPDDLDKLRMQFEGIKAIREKYDGGLSFLYEVTFTATDRELTLSIASGEKYVMDGYLYDVMVAGIDLYYLDSLFAE